MVSQDYIFELTQRSDIVEVIQSHVQLRRRGRTYTGLCPFHNEKTPSFVVYPETQSFYCFGCGAGGGAIQFIMRLKSLDFIEAVKELASRCGMPAPDEDDTTGKQRARILSINKDTARFYFQCLNSEQGAGARAYWRGRGLSDATIKRFGLGFAPDDFHALRDYLRTLHYTDDEAIEAGVIKRSEKGNTYDVFRNRVMVPIFDLRGNVVAFGGRVMGDEKPKYINSPETLAYKKSRTIFALNIAKKHTGKRFILCEGYMDSIAMHQAGFETAIACCGTALTSEQVKLMSDYTDEVVLCYDSDEAGQKATARAMELFAPSAVKISVLKVPDAKDPDEYIRKFGAERFQALIEGSANAIEFRLAQAKAKYDLASLDGRLSYIKDAINLLAQRANPTERDVYAGRLAQETDVAKTAISTQLATAIKARAKQQDKKRQRDLLSTGVSARINVPYSAGGKKAMGVAFAEQQLVMSIIKNPSLLQKIAQKIAPHHFISEDMRFAYECLLTMQNNLQMIELSVLAVQLPAETTALLSQMLAQNYDIAVSEQDVDMYITRIENANQQTADVANASLDEFAAYIERKKQNHMQEENG